MNKKELIDYIKKLIKEKAQERDAAVANNNYFKAAHCQSWRFGLLNALDIIKNGLNDEDFL